jgi:hypothetical protein
MSADASGFAQFKGSFLFHLKLAKTRPPLLHFRSMSTDAPGFAQFKGSFLFHLNFAKTRPSLLSLSQYER